MAASYPGSVKTFSTKAPGQAIASSHINELQDEIVAVETQLGVNAGAWQDWTPASQTGWTDIPTGTYRYSLVGKILHFLIDISAGTSNATSAILALPVTPSRRFNGANGFAVDNGTAITTAWFIETDGNIYFYTNTSAGTWTASGTKCVRVSGFYEVA